MRGDPKDSGEMDRERPGRMEPTEVVGSSPWGHLGVPPAADGGGPGGMHWRTGPLNSPPPTRLTALLGGFPGKPSTRQSDRVERVVSRQGFSGG